MRRTVFRAVCLGGGLMLTGAVPAALAAGWNFAISELTYDQVDAAVAYNSQEHEYLVVWENLWPGNTDIYGQRIREDGGLSGAWFAISVGSEYRVNADVAYNDDRNEYLVVWETVDGLHKNVHGWRISAAGQLLGGELTLGAGTGLRDRWGPTVAYATVAEKYLVAWTAHTLGAQSSDIEAQVISGAGALDGINFLIAEGTPAESHDQPDVAYNRSRNEYLVVWVHDAGDPSISARRVQGNGTPMYPAVITVNNWANDELRPRVAAIPTTSNNGKYMVVWLMIVGAPNVDVYSRVVDGEGNPGSMIAVASANHTESLPDVAGSEATGTFRVAWRADVGAATELWQQELSLNNSFVGGATLIGEDNADNPSVAADGDGGFLVAYDTLPIPPNGRDIYGWMSSLVFSDGFEAGSTGAWSAAIP